MNGVQAEFDVYVVGVYLERLKETSTTLEVMAWIETIPARLSRRVFIALAIAVSGCECGRKG